MESLDGTLAVSAARCSHLVMDKLTRTAKLMAAINTCQYIVTSQWLRDSETQKTWAGKPRKCHRSREDESLYALTDADVEGEYKFSLADSLARAQEGKVCMSLDCSDCSSMPRSPST